MTSGLITLHWHTKMVQEFPNLFCVLVMQYPSAAKIGVSGCETRLLLETLRVRPVLVCTCSTYRAQKLQALRTTQLLASRVDDLKSAINEISTAIKEDINDVRLTFTELSSRWSSCQQQIEKGNW